MFGKVFYRFALIFSFVGWAFLVEATGKYPFSNSFFTNINGIELHYRHWKPAPDVDQTLEHCLFLHGFSGSTFSWEGVADSLQKLGYEIVALDIPPFGYSDKSPRINQSVTARAELVHAFLEEVFPGEQWNLTGHSMGGGIAQALALMYPGTFVSVCFVAATLFSSITSHEESEPSRGTERRKRGSVLGIWPLRPLAGSLAESFFITRRRVGKLLESAYGTEPGREQVEAYLAPLRIPGTAEAILASGRRNREIATLDATGLTVPAFAIWGENDTWVPYPSREKILEKMPGVKVYIIPGAGHNPMETHLDAFMETWSILLNP